MLRSVLARRLTALMEDTSRQVLQRTGKNDVLRSKQLVFYYKGLEQDKDSNAVTVWKIPSARKEGTQYDVFVGIVPKGDSTLFSVAKNRMTLGKKQDLLQNADVSYYCSCDRFRYSGMAYNAKHGGMMVSGHTPTSGGETGEDIPPNIMDPNRKNVVCKHIVAAFKGIKTNAVKIMYDAKNMKVSPPTEDHSEEAISALGKSTSKPTQSNGTSVNTDATNAIGQSTDRQTSTKQQSGKNISGKPEAKDNLNAQVEAAASDALNSLGYATEKVDTGNYSEADLEPKSTEEPTKNEPDLSSMSLPDDLGTPERSTRLPMSDIEDAANQAASVMGFDIADETDDEETTTS